MEFKIHPVDWTDEKVSRFWTFQNQYAPFEASWFTKQVGSGLINFFKKRATITGKILDYGTGKGHLVDHLLRLGSAKVYGFDFSPESITNVDGKYHGRQGYMGTTLIRDGANYTGFDSGFFDIVFLIEAIEHLTDKYLNSTIDEIQRILKPDGLVIVTTPNEENLSLQHVLCPDCGALFHRVQHMRSFNKQSLSALMASRGFKATEFGTTNFNYYNTRSIKAVTKRIISGLRPNYIQPHLWYIGRKVDR